MLIYVGEYERPTSSRPLTAFAQTKCPAIIRDKFEPGIVHDKHEFIEQALRRKSPFAAADEELSAHIPADLAAAIDYVWDTGPDIVQDRQERLLRLHAIASMLGPLREILDTAKSDCSKEIASDFNVAFTAALIDAMQWPDVNLPVQYMTGFPVVFDIPDSGVFRSEDQPAAISPEKFKQNNAQMVSIISEEIRTKCEDKSDPENAERAHACWERTKQEIEDGLISSPKSRSKIDKKYGRGKWRCLGRSAILQKKKWRCIDNGKRSKHNKATHLKERITSGRAEFPATMAREFAKRKKISKRPWKLRMQHGTNDAKAAYRRVPTSQPEYTLVAVYNTDTHKVEYIEVWGHNFGLKSAVVNYNRSPELFTCAARRLLAIVTEHYVDDNDTSEPDFAAESAQKALKELLGNRLIGFPFDDSKDEDVDDSNIYLGVLTDFTEIEDGTIVMDVSRDRREKLKQLVQEVQRAQELRSGLAASIFGKARFTISPCFGCVGKACLQPIMAREYQPHVSELTPELQESLEFIEFLADHLPPTEVPLLPDQSDPVIIFTDAEGKRRNHRQAPTGHIAFVVIHPEYGRVHAHAPVPESLIALLDNVKRRQTYIGQWELVAMITPFISLPANWLAGRPVELWADNSGAIGACIKGYSGLSDHARLVNMFHFAVAKAGISSLWIDYVASESNIADVPSRAHEMEADDYMAYADALGELVPMTIPEFASASGEWLPFTSIASSVWNLH